MKVTKQKEEKNRREYVVSVPAKEVDAEIAAGLKKFGKEMKVPGFRPGKVPVALVKKQYGVRVKTEVLESLLGRTTAQALKNEKIKPAGEPKIEIIAFDEGKDFEYKIVVELLPEVPAVDFGKLSIEREVIEVADSDLQEALEALAEQYLDYQKVERDTKSGDMVVMDFKGFIDGKAFKGGEAKGYQLVLGSGQFIPGFEDQLIGQKIGKQIEVKVPFPKNYHQKDLAGKESLFEVTIHEVKEGKKRSVDDGLATTVGEKDLASLQAAMKARIEQEYGKVARNRAKKQLFDVLDEAVKVDAPESFVENEFKAIWQQVGHGHDHDHDHVHDENCNHDHDADDAQKEEYRTIARRRVKLGIVLADIAEKNSLKVTDQEVSAAFSEEIRNYPGQEKQVIEYYQKNPKAIEALRGPILEEKAVDFLFQTMAVKEKKITAGALKKILEAEIKAEQAEEEQKAAKKTKKSAKASDESAASSTEAKTKKKK